MPSVSTLLTVLLPLLSQLPIIYGFDYKTYCGTQASSSASFSACQTKLRNIIVAPVNNRLSIGSSDVAAYVTLQYYELDGTFQSQTAQFFPVVDDYTKIKVANISGFKPYNPHVDVTFLAKNEKNQISLYKTDVPKLWVNRTSIVPYRSVVVTLDLGVIQNVKWESTFCQLPTCECTDNMCAECNDFNDNCESLTIYVMWAGTDAQNKVLNSASKSIYKFQMLP